jgi:translation initiation factor IF-2
VFHLSGKSSAVVAGVIVESGRLRSKGSSSGIQDNNSAGGGGGDYGYVFRVKRNGQVLMAESKGGVELKRFKTLVHEVESGNECGVSLDGFDEYQEGDELECLKVIWRAQTQVLAPAPDESMSAYGSSSKRP